MGKLIDGLLGRSQLTRGEMKREPVDLTALARSVAEERQNSQPQRSAQFLAVSD